MKLEQCPAINARGHQCVELKGHEDQAHPNFDSMWIVNGVPVHGAYIKERGGYEIWPDVYSDEAAAQLSNAQSWNGKPIREEKYEAGAQSVWLASERKTEAEVFQEESHRTEVNGNE